MIEGLTAAEWKADYQRLVNAAWPTPTPFMSFEEGRAALRRLLKAFGWRGRIKKFIEVSGVRTYNGATGGGAFGINPLFGWSGLVHTASHMIVWRHGNAHLKLERRMILYVVGRGWLDGRFKVAARPPVSKAAARAARVQARADKARRMLARADRDTAAALRRAAKWRRRVAYYDKAAPAIPAAA